MFDALRARVRHPRREETLPDAATSLFDDDVAVSLLSEELRGLGQLRVAPAPRERTLALVRREVRAQEARGAFEGSSRRTFSRLAFGGAALLVAASLGLFALADRPGNGDQMAGSSSTSDSLVAEVGTTTDTQSQSPDTTGASLPGPDTSLPGTVTSQAPGTTLPATTQSTDHPATTDGPSPTSPPSSVRPHTTTTVAPGTTTTTTGSAVMTWADREDSARTVVLSLADKITTGALAGVDTYVASSAKSGLAWMIASLERPSSAWIVAVKETSSGARVLLEMSDNVSNGQGGLVKVQRGFYFETRADKNGTLITAIYAGPAQ